MVAEMLSDLWAKLIGDRLATDPAECCPFCERPLLEYPYCRCDYLGFTRTEAERRRQRIRSAIGMPESGRA